MSGWMVLLLITLPLPWVAKVIWPHKIQLLEIVCTLLITTAVISAVYFAGTVGRTWDNEIWNGEITGKERDHGHYLRPYQCNCYTTCSGSGANQSCSETCSTCFEDRYTVTWSAKSSIGSFTIQHLDRGSSSVYNTPDPGRYTIVQIGDPCSKAVSFTNYVKAVPESLFHANPLLQEKFAGKVPAYPGNIYDLYKIYRVLSVEVNVSDIAAWNHELSLTLRKLGPHRQANAIIVFVNTNDPNYQYALESAWLGGKKNDIIVLLGTPNYPNIDWVGVVSWTDKQLFKVQLRDDLLALKQVDRTKILETIDKHTSTTFVRKNMKDFEYLKDQIEPPLWVVLLALVLGVFASLGASFYFYHNDPFKDAFRSTYPRFRR
jgi:hypothetical protein